MYAVLDITDHTDERFMDVNGRQVFSLNAARQACHLHREHFADRRFIVVMLTEVTEHGLLQELGTDQS